MTTFREQRSSEHVEKEQERRWWLDVCLVAGGVACDWYLAFQWFSGKYPPLSTTVLRAAALIVVLCAIVSVLLVRVLGKKGWKLRDYGVPFCVTSITVLFNMLVYWVGTHR